MDGGMTKAKLIEAIQIMREEDTKQAARELQDRQPAFTVHRDAQLSPAQAVELLHGAKLPPGMVLGAQCSPFSVAIYLHLANPVTCAQTGAPVMVTQVIELLPGTRKDLAARLLAEVKGLLAHEAEEWVSLDGVYAADPHDVRPDAWSKHR